MQTLDATVLAQVAGSSCYTVGDLDWGPAFVSVSHINDYVLPGCPNISFLFEHTLLPNNFVRIVFSYILVWP